jgi:hypothetical protein
MGFVIWPFTVHEKSSLLVIARNSKAADLDDIHIIARNTQLPVKSKPFLQQSLLSPGEMGAFRQCTRRVRFFC